MGKEVVLILSLNAKDMNEVETLTNHSREENYIPTYV